VHRPRPNDSMLEPSLSGINVMKHTDLLQPAGSII
jgi:hypothetical protein